MLLREIAEKAEANRGRQILLVPELNSHQMERRLAAATHNHGARTAEVLTFSRLADRVFAVVGGLAQQMLTPAGQLLTLQEAARRVQVGLTAWSGLADKPELLSETLALIDECKSCMIEPEMLFRASEESALDEDAALSAKLCDLAQILTQYDSLCEETLPDPRDRLTHLRDGLAESHVLDGAEVYLDGFLSYTPPELAISDVRLENVGQIICDGRSSFGNGVEVTTINEAGGREVPIYDGLTAQIAYVLAMYRHRTRTVERLRGLIARYAESRTASRGAIGRGSSVVNTLSLLNVSVGEGASIDGAASLCNGTLNSTFESPSRIGSGVTASDFVVACSATVDTGSMLRRCFVGEGVVIENGFSAENSLFFANSHLNHGEACAVFAGPYTVSHHRSTLLIAGYFSFFNAGSGANQSNHMYKSGPVHQGVHLRGCKFGSDAYVLLPASTGAFTIVTGRHYNHHDTERMPFSYLVEEAGDSVLLPAVNIRSCGTARDIDKWPRRDRRRGVAHDLIRYDMMNPYPAGRVLDARGECEALIGRHPTAEAVTWNRVKIKTPSLRKGLVLYRQALRSYLAGLLGEGMADARPDASLRQWVDLAGLIAPRSRVEALLDRIDRGEIDDLNRLEEAFREIDRRYEADARRWALYALSVLLGKPEESIGSDDIGELVRQGADDRRALEAAVGQDALRDRAPVMATGYGIDAPEQREADFRAVRGER